MSSLNKIMMLWHAYHKAGSKRIHLGYYQTKEDADEAEKLKASTSKRIKTRQVRAEKKADVAIEKLVARRDAL